MAKDDDDKKKPTGPTHLLVKSTRPTEFRRAGIVFPKGGAWQAFELAKLGAEKVATLEADKQSITTRRCSAEEAAELVADSGDPDQRDRRLDRMRRDAHATAGQLANAQIENDSLRARVIELETANENQKRQIAELVARTKSAPPV